MCGEGLLEGWDLLRVESFPDAATTWIVIPACEERYGFIGVDPMRHPCWQSFRLGLLGIDLVNALPTCANGGEVRGRLGVRSVRRKGGLLGYRHGDAVITLFIGTGRGWLNSKMAAADVLRMRRFR